MQYEKNDVVRVRTCALMRKKIEKYNMNRKMGNRRSMIQPLYISTLHARNSQTNGLGMRDVSCPFTRVCIIFVLTYAYSLMHLFMEDPDSKESTGQMRNDKIASVPNDTAIATREDSIYIRNFCSLTANTRNHIYHTRSELSVSGEILRLLFAFVKVLPPVCSPNCFNLCTYCITNSQAGGKRHS